MNAKELRIGNYAFDKVFNIMIKFDSFYGLCNIESKPDNYEPISLTEEWLLKFGFNIKEVDWFSISIKRPFIRLEVNLKEKRCILFDTKKLIFIDIKFTKYVHTLQNTYKELSGNELKHK